MEIFCFLIGILLIYTSNLYLLLLIGIIFYISPNYRVLALFVGGVILALLHQGALEPQGLPGDQVVISNALLQGTIASIPAKTANKTQFTFTIEQFNHQPAHGLVQLAWYNNAPIIRVGERWQFSVKLKKPHNFLNPGSFDYVQSLNTRHIYWTGYIHPHNNVLIPGNAQNFNLLRLREYLANQLTRLSPDLRTAGIIEALTLNMTTHISQQDWDLFRRTGTTHLYGISGEHIALVAGLFSFIVQFIWSRSTRACLKIPAISIASVGGLTIALLYAFLAGFAPPVQRALTGCFFYTLYSLGKKRFTPWQIWRYALIGVLILEPHAVFMQGFYFSFLAVACLFLTQQRWQLKGYKGSLALQLSCLIGLMPLSLYWFGYGSINGFIANIFAIPLVGFLIVPLALLTMVFSSFTWVAWLIEPLTWIIHFMFIGLSWTEHLAFININWALNSIIPALTLLGAFLILVLLPIRSLLQLAVLWLILMLFPHRVLLEPGEFTLAVLDVGQGLAVAIRTNHHALLYDTGDQFFQGSDLGKMVVLPYYATTDVKIIDKIVISHPDKDHRGGLKSIQDAMPVQQLLVNNPKYYHHGINCHHFPAWQWDGVYFNFLPIPPSLGDKNNTSCILQVSNAQIKILLTGDIERSAEDYLVKTYGKQLKSDILIVPHHGSKTSSSYRFILEVAPRYAVASLGFANRFRFPHLKTLTTFAKLNIPFIRTDECGMTQFFALNNGKLDPPQCYSGKKIALPALTKI